MPERLATDEGRFKYDICVVGGCGHVGLPLAITFAKRGLNVSIYDINERAVEHGPRGADAVPGVGRRAAC